MPVEPTVIIVLSQFGPLASSIEPAFSSYKVGFPDAQFVLYTDNHSIIIPDGLNRRVVNPPFNRSHPRYGYRSNDYYKIKGLLDADTDVAIAVDSDTLVLTDAVRTLPGLAQKFGLCVPANPRRLVWFDAIHGTEGDPAFKEPYGWCYAVNMTPIAYSRDNAKAKALLERYLVSQTSGPRLRGPQAMWREIWHSGFMPCILPPQWCVCSKDCGCGNEIILHTGQYEVRWHYGIQVKQ